MSRHTANVNFCSDVQVLLKENMPVTCQSTGEPVAIKSHLTECPRLRLPSGMNIALGVFTQNVCLVETSNVRKQSQPQ